ncbi:hypothetical protein HF086_013247 [Spodoptera exigua]|uniref:Uncharacterized protein n=1 Tax=Spodoptera exigua TaxID=7107 RepID=A0A922MEZ1_SPOEX|nr:hypothetical protein HF086_013247 [Spodoptera exigua]
MATENKSQEPRPTLSEEDVEKTSDQRPSQLLRHMRDLARDKMPDETLRMLWMSHLPSSTRAVLAVSEESKVDTLAVMADKMQEQLQEVNVVFFCQCQPSMSKAAPAEIAATSVLAEQSFRSTIEALTRKVG